MGATARDECKNNQNRSRGDSEFLPVSALGGQPSHKRKKEQTQASKKTQLTANVVGNFRLQQTSFDLLRVRQAKNFRAGAGSE